MAEARFYCEEHNYDFANAKAAYDEDKAFEEQETKKGNEAASKKRR